ANPTYFEGAPKVNNLEFLIETSSARRLRDLIRNRCQIDSTFPPQSLTKIRSNPSLKAMAAPGLNLSYLAFNVQRMPFSDLKFRQAVYYALNREEYVKDIYNGQAEVAKNPIPPTMWSFDRTTPDYRYDPNKAKELLHELGIPSGFVITLSCPTVERPYDPDPLKLANLIKSDLERVGLTVKIQALDWQVFLKKSHAGDLAFSLQGWTGDNGDPDNFLNNLLSCDSISSGNNRAHWCNREFSFLVDRARVTSNVRIRTRFYKQAQKIFHKEIPWVPIANNTIFKALRKNVIGYEVSPFGVDYFANVDLK
ncbi:MAG TPA: ABC transporter substrate-binding protein, partial [Candidatus Baltobacteraceae bacterium]|nr:ABC transporter substrate-binding protein [Candidatus Baltobacteraceae bacterium]